MPLKNSDLPGVIQLYARRLASTAATAAEAMAEVDPRVPRGTKPHAGPRLSESFRIGPGVTGGGNQLVVSAQNIAPHAEYTDKGTVPHEIRPKRARALRFEAGGGVVFAKSVQHPGTTGTKWFEPVVGDAWQRALAQAVLLL